MILPIYLYGSPVLRQTTKDIEPGYPQINNLIANMFDTMYNADGVGLAAPQIGLSISLIVVSGKLLADDRPELKDFTRALINPKVIEASEETCVFSEGCLSLPSINAEIERPCRIKVAYMDQDFRPQEEWFEGFACRMVQHEMSHLRGELFTDLAPAIRRKMFASKLQNIAKGRVSADYKTKISKL